MLAAVACGEYPSVGCGGEALIHVKETVHPDPKIAARYEVQYRKFREIYPTLKALFPRLQG